MGFALKGELLFFARTKKTNEKKVRVGCWTCVNSKAFGNQCLHILCSTDIGTSVCLSPVNRYFVASVRRAFLARATLKWPSLAISASRASLLGILKGEVKSRAKQERGANLLRSFAGLGGDFLPEIA